MTDKEAIKYLKQLYPNGGHCWLDEQRIEAISMAIKAMQEEPVSEKKCLLTKDNYTDEDRKVLCEDCDEDCEYAKKEKPVSEELEQAAVEAFKEIVDDGSNSFFEIFKAGAKWQKEKDGSITEDLGEYINELSKQFPEVSFAKLSRIAVRVAKWKEQKDNVSVSEDLEKEIQRYYVEWDEHPHYDITARHFAKWQKEHLWKPADGDDLPEIDREVIALLDNGKVVFAHRPPEFWDGKDIVTGKVTRNYPKTYDKGGWNIPNIKYWLDCQIPKIEED